MTISRQPVANDKVNPPTDVTNNEGPGPHHTSAKDGHQGSPGSGSRRATSIPVARIHHAGKPGEGNHVPLIDKGARLADKARA
jgi:hypothetical protein